MLSKRKKQSSVDYELKLATTLYVQEELNEFAYQVASSNDPEMKEHQFSEKFLQSMEDIFEEERRQAKREVFQNVMKIAACFALVIVCGGVIAGGKVEAWKETIYNKFFRKEFRYTETGIREGSSKIEALREKYPKLYLPDALPEDMQVEVRLYNEEAERYNWRAENEEKFISVTQTKTAKIAIDTEKIELNKMKSNGITYYWTKDERGSTMTWEQDEYQFVLTSSFSIKSTSVFAETFKK